MMDACDDYGFRFLDCIENPPIRLIGVGKQSRYSKEYYWDNSMRSHCFLFQYTLSGSGTLKTEKDVYILKEGTAFFLEMPDEDVYFFDEVNNQAPWEFIYVMFDGNGVGPYHRYIKSRVGKVMELSMFHPAIRELFELYQRAKKGQFKSSFEADKAIFDFLCLLCVGEDKERKITVPLVEEAKEYLKDNFDQEVSLMIIAEKLGVSHSHLSREFMRHTGEQPVKYLTKLRLEKAIEMLCSTKETLSDISYACGFGDVNYFCKVFRKYMHISPGEFRKQVKIHGYKNIQI